MLKIKSLHYKIALVCAVLILVSYFALVIIGDNGWRDLNAMKQELKNIKAKNEQIKQENVDIYQKIERIKADPNFMENTAREQLKMIGQDEVVFKFDNPNSSKNKPASPNNEPIPPINNEDPQKSNAQPLNGNNIEQPKNDADTTKSEPDASIND